MGYDFLKDNNILPDPNNLQNTHVLLGEIKVNNPEDAFNKLQGENWSPYGEARAFIQNLQLKHTSMSVGDIITTPDDTLLCDVLGFIKL